MAILTGTSKTRFPPFTDPNTGAGVLFDRAQNIALDFLGQSQKLFEEQFVEDGVSNIPGFSTIERSYAQVKKPTRRHTFAQRVQATVFIKKRIFSTLRSNYDIRFMNAKEKVFMRASKKMFLRKTQDLAFYESLSNIENLFDDDGHLNVDRVSDGILDSILTLVSGVFTGIDFLGEKQTLISVLTTNPFLAPFGKMLLQFLELKEINQRAKGNQFTTWITDPSNPDLNGIGSGVGVIELNQVDSLSTTVSVETGGGNATLSMQDPYRTMVITDLDIEIALRDAIAETDTPAERLDDVATDLLSRAQAFDIKLNNTRRARGVSEINFSFILGTVQPTGSLVETGQEFDVFTLSNVDFAGTEEAISREIFGLLGAWHTAQQRTMNLFSTVNEEFSDVRQRMRNEYLGHAIIQQMDAVHIFINSRTRDITPNGDTPVNLTDFLTEGLQFQGDALDISSIQTEHELTAPDIPFILYAAMRDRSVFRQDGNQVFSGLVEKVNTSYAASNGSFTIRVSCRDNIKFLELGRFTRSPNLAQPKAMLYDPLTPFELKTDPATGLRQGEPELSAENKKRLRYLRFDDGLLAGDTVTEKNIFQEKLVGGRVTTFQHMPGLIYKWKDGIISESLTVATRKPLSGVGATVDDIVSTYGVTHLQNPFGGLDAADTVSILVTGRPHNYSTFFKHALDSGTFSLDNTNQNKSYFNYLFDFLERQDSVFGNFFPAVDSPVDPIIAAAAFKQKKVLDGLNDLLLKEQAELARLEDQDRARTGQKDNNDSSAEASEEQTEDSPALGAHTATTRSDIQKIKQNIADINTAGQEGLFIGNDNIDAVSLGVAGNDTYLSFADVEIKNIKQRLKFTLKKKPEEVRYNVDKNYFIVSDEYTSNTDIQAFARNLKKSVADLWNSDYESPKDLCVTAKETIGFEFFANAQGNIVFRPPQYNRTPLSLLLKLMGLRRSEGVSYAPDFLESLFKKRSDMLLDEIKLVELKILRGLILLGEKVTMKGYLTRFSFPTGDKHPVGLNMAFSLIATDSNDSRNGNYTWSIDEQALREDVNKATIFDIEQQSALRTRNVGGVGAVSEATLLITVENEINGLTGKSYKKRLPAPAGEDVKAAQTEISKQSSASDSQAQINRLGIINDMSQEISDRQRLAKTWAATQDNRASFRPDGFGPFGPQEDTASEPFIPSSVSAQLRGVGIDPVFPKFMEHLIENDLSNEDGFRSGKRFIIEDDVIISMDITVVDPEFNFIEVTGNQDFLNTDASNGKMGSIPFLFWAGSVDFDSWRRFGFRPGKTIHRADFVDSESQCAPYAVFKLQEQRRWIHQGSVTVMGNEFYQVGDVIYLNNKSSLFYVENVSHSFDFGSGNFQTTLELTYGRALGEYIPTTLDIIGKGVLANSRKSVGNVKANRSSVSSNHVTHVGTLYLEDYLLLNPTNESSARTAFVNAPHNIRGVKNAIVKAQSRINTVTEGKTIRVEVRSYYLDPKGSFLNPAQQIDAALTKSRASAMGGWVREMLIGLASTSSSANGVDESTPSLPSGKVIQVNPINIDPDEEFTDEQKALRMFPSSQAWTGKNPFTASDGVGLPLNAVDIFFVVEENKTGDQ